MRARHLDVRGLDRGEARYGDAVAAAAEILAGGGLVAFPTETVYGLGALAGESDAVKRIFDVKGRPRDNPLIVHAADAPTARRLCGRWPDTAARAAERFWPGPLTLILPRLPGTLPDAVSAGLATVAVRVPAQRVALDLLARAGPVVAPSANRSGRPSPTRAQHVLADLGGAIEAVLDDGPCPVGVESTVVDLTGRRPVVLRPGGVQVETLAEALGPVDAGVDAESAGDRGGEAAPRSPGTRYRHYAPATPLHVVRGESLTRAKRGVADEVARLRGRGLRVGVLAAEEVCAAVGADAVVSLGPFAQPDAAARGMFAALRDLDARGADVLVAHTYPPAGHGIAVSNRLLRGASRVAAPPPAALRRVLLVCTGNTCRSPMGAASLRALAERAGVPVQVRSAGVRAADGGGANPRAAEVVAERDLDLAGHRTRRLETGDVAWADVVLTMERAQREQVRALHPEAAERVYTLAEYAGEGDLAGTDIDDPVGGDGGRYRECLGRIEGYLRRIVRRWQAERR